MFVKEKEPQKKQYEVPMKLMMMLVYWESDQWQIYIEELVLDGSDKVDVAEHKKEKSLGCEERYIR